MTRLDFTGSALCLGLLVVCSAAAQTIDIWPGVAPGSENWSQQERVAEGPAGNTIYNVVTPTLTAYLPDPSTATGTGVIVAPGGAFRFLSIDMEGHDVARWLAARGVAGFVLKYRVVETPPDFSLAQLMSELRAPGEGAGGGGGMDEAGKHGVADGIQAVRVVREHAAEWGIAPDRVGIVGFSAGAMVTTGTLLQDDAAARPNFAAPIYGGPFGAMPPIPAGLPPVFLAWAQDDALAGAAAGNFSEALKAAGYSPEVHIFSAGGHGFGMRKQGTTSDHWIDEFYYWLEAQGLTKPAQ